MHKVFIDGKDGTTGLRIHEYLRGRDDIEIIYIDEAKRKNIDERIRLISESDLTLLCLPDEASREIMSLVPKDTRVLDTSTAHRIDAAWVYGLPEIGEEQKDKIKNAGRVAVPGCHATGFVLLVRPLIEKGIVKPDYPFTCHSVTGYSGGGKKMIAEYEDPDRNFEYESPRQYGLLQNHKHLPEMTAMTGISFEPAFNPIVSGYLCGMTVSLPITTRLLDKNYEPEDFREIYAEHYQNCPMIDIMDTPGPAGGFISANKLAGINTVQIIAYGNHKNVMLAARYDNLGKGASGGAVQCMNLMLGIPEEKGLKEMKGIKNYEN